MSRDVYYTVRQELGDSFFAIYCPSPFLCAVTVDSLCATMSTPSPRPVQTYMHARPKRTILPFLSTHYLPAAVPLVRRLQFHYSSAHAVAIATFPAADSTRSCGPTPVPWVRAPEPFAILLLDRSRAPETEAWLFSSIETGRSPRATSGIQASDGQISPGQARVARAQLLAILARAESIAAPPNYAADADPHLMKLGSVHEISLALLMGWSGGHVASIRSLWHGGGAVAQAPSDPSAAIKRGSKLSDAETAPLSGEQGGGVVLSHTIPYVKFVIDPQYVVQAAAHAQPAPEGLMWDRVRPGDYNLVIGRTHIPRTPRTLALMPGVALRLASLHGGAQANDHARQWTAESVATTDIHTPGRPIGWAFLSPDASLATLHVEQDYRGRGLGTVLAQRAIGLLGPAAAAGAQTNEANGNSDDQPNGSVHPPYCEQHNATDDINEPTALSDLNAAFPLHRTPEQAWIHVDIARDNAASQAVVRRLGAREAWEAFWVVVSLSKAREASRAS